MNLQDTLYNWLSIRKVVEERPDDHAAKDTYDFFAEILTEDHHIEDLDVVVEGQYYIVVYAIDGEWLTKQFPVELIDALYESIAAEPKYNS